MRLLRVQGTYVLRRVPLRNYAPVPRILSPSIVTPMENFLSAERIETIRSEVATEAFEEQAPAQKKTNAAADVVAYADAPGFFGAYSAIAYRTIVAAVVMLGVRLLLDTVPAAAIALKSRQGSVPIHQPRIQTPPPQLPEASPQDPQ